MSSLLAKRLLVIANSLNKTGVSWALTGEGTLMVWGVDVIPKSINITVFETPQQGIERIKFHGVLIPVYSLDTELRNCKHYSTEIKKRIKELQSNDCYGYVQMDLDKKTKQLLHQAVSYSVDPEQSYYSDSISYIKGDVTAKAHMTVCYGVKNSDLHERFAKSNLAIQNSKESIISKIGFWTGFKDEYYLIFAIPEENKELYMLDNWIRKYNDISEKSLSFEPHISLCYIKHISKKSLDAMILELSKNLVGKKIKFESVSFFKPITEEKKAL